MLGPRAHLGIYSFCQQVLPLSVVHPVSLGFGGALLRHAAAEAFSQETLLPALHHICPPGRNRGQSIYRLSSTGQRDPSLAFCPPANIQTICDSVPNVMVRNESYFSDTHSSLFTSCFTSLFSMTGGRG